jgi:hypothetical protein
MQVCVSDDNGNYNLGWYPKSKPVWSISVAHKDYADQSRSNIAPPAEGNTATSDFVLDHGNEIVGTVKDADGNAIKGASVRYGSDWSLIGLRWARTDEAGRFKITKIGRDESRAIVAEAKGYAPTWQRARPGKGEDVPHLEFVMVRGTTVTGRVVDRAGKPVSGVMISPQMKIEGRAEYVGDRITVGEKGEFKIASLPDSGTSLDVYGNGISPVRHFAFDPDPARPLVITVDKPGVIIGRVLDAETHDPVKKFNVRLGFPKEIKGAGEPSASYSAHLSDRGQNSESGDGRFVIEDLITRAGHAVTITADGYSALYVDKVIARPEDDPVWPQDFLMDRGLIILGRLTDAVNGDPVGGARVYYVGKPAWYSANIYASHLADLRRMGAYDDVNMVSSDSSGAVELRLARKSTQYTAIVIAPGYAPLILAGQSAASAVCAVPPLAREAKIHGTAAGLEGLSVGDTAELLSGLWCADWVPIQKDGTFEIGGLPPGRSVLNVRNRAGTIKGGVILDLKAGEIAAVDVARQSPGTIKVIVTRNGVPEPDATVWFRVNDWPGAAIAQVGRGTTGKDGTVTLQHLPLIKGTVQCVPHGKGISASQAVDMGDAGHSPEVHLDVEALNPKK